MIQSYVEVVIGKKTYRLATSDGKGEAYIMSLAKYIDDKLNELTSASGNSIIHKESFPILFALNIAEDLFTEIEKNSDSEAAIREQELQKQIEQLNKKIEIYRTQDNENKTRWDNLISQLQASAEENNLLKETLQEMSNALEENMAISEKNANENQVYEQQLSDKLVQINELSQKISDKNQELNQLSVKLAEKNTLLNELNIKSAERNKKLNLVNKERDELTVKLKVSKARISELEKNLELMETKMQLGSKGYSSLQKEKTELDRELDMLKQENLHLKSNCEELTQENARLTKERKPTNTRSKKQV